MFAVQSVMGLNDGLVTEEKLLDSITKMDDRIRAAIVQMGDRDKTKDVALGTSKLVEVFCRIEQAYPYVSYQDQLHCLSSKQCNTG